MGALDAPEGPHPVDVAVPRAAVDLIRPDHESHEFLKHVHVFIRTPGRHQPGNRIGPVGRFQRQQLPGNVSQGVFPGDRGKGAVGLTNKRGLHAIRMVTDVIAEISARAEVAVVPPGAKRRIHFDQLIVLSLDRDLASIAAIGTDGLRSFQHPRTIVVH